MASFIFDNGTQAQAAAFDGTKDKLTFGTDPSTISVTYTAGSTSTVPATNAYFTISNGAHTLNFDAAAFGNGINDTSFISGGNMHIEGGTTPLASGSSFTVASTDAVVFAFTDKTVTNGSDTASAVTTDITFNGHADTTASAHLIRGTVGADVITLDQNKGANTIYGGDGSDSITLGNGNNHVYGGNNVAGQTDGADTIIVGTGSNYINGNAGKDVITAGSSVSTGGNNIFGGADNDTITVNGGTNHVNGNAGDDVIKVGVIDNVSANSFSHNTLLGGQGNDTITGGAFVSGGAAVMGSVTNSLQGNLGNDVLIAGDKALNILTGGAGNDLFTFGVSTVTTIGSGSSAQTYFNEVTDFTAGSDKLNIGIDFSDSTVAKVTTSASSFASETDAANYANTTITGTVKAALTQVGSDTYLFWGAGATNVVKLDGVTAANVHTSDFSMATAHLS